MWGWIKSLVKRLFGHKTTDETEAERDLFSANYSNMDYNVTAIFANKFSTLTVTDSNVDVNNGQDSEQERIRYLDNVIQRVWKKGKKITNQALGLGGVAIVPYYTGEDIYFSLVPQNRLEINSMIGDKIASCTFCADRIVREGVQYHRLSDYTLENGGCYIRNKATKDYSTEIKLSDVPEWDGIPGEIFIPNCKKLPFGFLKCPVDNRRSDDTYGVPITYGCDELIKDIKDCMEQIRVEYKQKNVKVFVDSVYLDKDKNFDEDLYVSFNGGGSLKDSGLVDIFDPNIRDSSLYKRLESCFAQLENAVGSSKGIMTSPTTTYATATEIIQANHNTYSIVWSIHQLWQDVFEDLLYACNVLCDFYNIVPPSTEEPKMKYDWSYTMIESPTETYMQMSDCNARGIIADEELRQFIKPTETLDEARKAIDAIQAKKEPEEVVDEDINVF